MNTTSQAWDDLVALATIGTERRPDRAPEDLLDAAAAATLYRRAGRLPERGAAPGAPAGPETAPLIGPAPQRRLATLLGATGGGPDMPDGENRMELLIEWLSLLAARGLRVPAEWLPALLDAGRRRRDVRPLILAAGGARVRWLAGQRADWGYLAGTDDESAGDDPAAWSQGTPGQRLGYLTALRRRDPDAARDLLAGEWGGLSGEERGQLIGALATGLGPADEDFLDAALDDRRKEVRAAAAELLWRLPGARYGDRMARRARECLRLGDGQVHVVPPAECDRDMRRAGINPKPPAGTGERAWWLTELLARTPVGVWPAELPDLRIADGWAAPVIRGLARAAAAQGDAAWADALLPAMGAVVAANHRGEDRQILHTLHATLPPARRVAAAERALRADPTDAAGPDMMLELCPAPWPHSLGEAVFAAVDTLLRADHHAYHLDGMCLLASLRLPADHAGAAAELAHRLRAESPDNYRLRSVDRMAGTLRFRYEMTKELA